MTDQQDPQRDTSAGRVASAGHGVFLNVIGNGLLPLVALLTAPILARSLGVEGRGAVASATAPFLLLSAVAAFGLPEAMTHFVARRAVNVKRTGWAVMLLSVGLGILGLAGVALLSEWLSAGDPAHAWLIIIVTIPLPMYLALGVLRGIASGLQAWGCVAAEQGLFAVSRLIAILLLVFTGHLTVLTASFVLTLAPLMGASAYLPLCRRHSVAAVEQASLSAVLDYGGRTWIGAVSAVLLYRIDQVLMAPLSSAEQLGLYVVAVAIGELPVIVSLATRNVAFATESESESLDVLARLTRLNVLLTGGASVVLALLAPWLVPLAFGRDFVGAVPVTLVMLAAAVVGAWGAVPGAGLAGRGRPGARSAALMAACIVNILLIVLLVAPFGAMGAAWATLGGSLVTSVLNLALMRRYFGARVVDFLLLRRSDIADLQATVRRFLKRSVPSPAQATDLVG